MTRPERHYSIEDMGPRCRYCLLRVPARSREDTHPTCGPLAAVLLDLDQHSHRWVPKLWSSRPGGKRLDDTRTTADVRYRQGCALCPAWQHPDTTTTRKA